MVLIRTAIKIKNVKKIINAKNNGGISISPKETKNKSNKIIINSKIIHYIVIIKRKGKAN